MGSPDAPGQGEPPYRPWPGEQLPYTPSTAASADAFTEPVPRPRRGRRRLRVTALLLAAVGISAGAVFFTRSEDPGPADDGGATGGLTVDPTDDPSDDPTDDPSPTEEESSTTEPVEPPTDDTDLPSETELASENTYVNTLSVGDCADRTESASYVVVVSCDAPHDVQNLTVTQLDDAFGFPGEDAVSEEAGSLCRQAYSEAEENWTAEEEEDLGLANVRPSSGSWSDGDRTVVCFLKSSYGGTLDENWLDRSFSSP
jgi:hypothetical protein